MTQVRRHIVLLTLVTVALVTRFADLGSRLFSHDESIHANFAAQLIEGRGYYYDPVYHGPLLYHLEAAVFGVGGMGETQARIPSAVGGVLLIVFLYRLLEPRLGQRVAALAAGLGILSPSITYYSRFNSHDSLIAALTIVLVVSALQATKTSAMWFALASALAISTKLNAYFVLASLAAYFVAHAVYRRIRGATLSTKRDVPLALRTVTLATLLFVVCVALLSISTFLHYGESQPPALAAWTTTKSVLADGFAYWWDMHLRPRLGASFHFYLPILVIYEPLVAVSAVAALIYFMRARRWFVLGLVLLLSVEWVSLSRLTAGGVFGLDRWHVLLATGWALAGGWAVVSLWSQKRNDLACWTFVAVLQFLLYSYANEKVPWLTVHILVPWLVVVSSFLVEYWSAHPAAWRRAAFVVLVIGLEAISLRAAWLVNTRNRSNAAEPLLHMPYAEDVDRTVRLIRARALSSRESAATSIEPTVQWPFAWYLRDLPLAYPPWGLPADETSPFLIADDGPVELEITIRYYPHPFAYYRWSTWIEDANRGDVRGMLRFMLFHDRWGNERSSPFVVWTRKDMAAAGPAY